ncbi:glycerol-3-phosphate acyltransferase PlsY [Kaistia hirudinis]|jgi:glycerol-3-phosphate acyltransferase PlsY|uniref:Glycerol-3-phosphate acyltransferase n=1 Tax=Kaistia hirudinis TaxID=1293440 RepID=A0A840AYJ4_9HYPH|nr:glycerol-3-phosphate 1-O-acyltransferase PlsY [Kaistia hirudinis]MBB3933286.1 glycerol-3-phosphate acyltransferase PlsY [Kaistia hirudinis]MBN9019753.1 glycerol-3-phosphate 1-O-acyltransferase PlsY [Hyphomicrobiales bacterium]
MDWQIGPALTVGVLVLGYLLGSIPFGLLLTRAAGLGDIRAIGSGNIGATNVLRTGNRWLAAATLICDALKGTAAVLIADRWGTDAALVAGLGAFLGHIFPIWLGFRGGKGVATFLGILIGISWPIAVVFAAIWLAVAGITRYSSLAALIASLATPLVMLALGDWRRSALFGLLTVLIWYKHSANISRLLAGKESRIGQKG